MNWIDKIRSNDEIHRTFLKVTQKKVYDQKVSFTILFNFHYIITFQYIRRNGVMSMFLSFPMCIGYANNVIVVAYW